MDLLVDRAELAINIREWIEEIQPGDVKVSRIKLLHEGSPRPFKTFHTLPKVADGDEADKFVSDVAQKLEADARCFNGRTQRYWIEAWTDDDDEGFVGRHGCELALLNKRNGTSHAGAHGPSEPATQEGFVALCMRLADSTVQRGMTNGTDVFGQINKALMAQLKADRDALTAERALTTKLHDEIGTMRAAFEAVQSMQVEREIMAKEAKRRGEMFEEAFKDFKMVAPIIANRLLGEKLLPEPELAPEQTLIRQLIRDLEGEEMQMVLNALASKSPRIGILFAELALKTQDEDVRRKEIGKALEAHKIEAEKRLAAGSSSSSATSSPSSSSANGSSSNGSPASGAFFNPRPILLGNGS